MTDTPRKGELYSLDENGKAYDRGFFQSFLDDKGADEFVRAKLVEWAEQDGDAQLAEILRETITFSTKPHTTKQNSRTILKGVHRVKHETSSGQVQVDKKRMYLHKAIDECIANISDSGQQLGPQQLGPMPDSKRKVPSIAGRTNTRLDVRRHSHG